jgi:ROS/MUCR transcriptional regulator protein
MPAYTEKSVFQLMHRPDFAENYFMENPHKFDVQQFPWDGRFETKAEIDNYLACDKVQCLLCNKKFKALHTHLHRTHNTTPDDYRERYGLPWKQGLCGTTTSKKLSNNMHERRKQGFRPPIEKTWEKTGKRLQKRSRQNDQRKKRPKRSLQRSQHATF